MPPKPAAAPEPMPRPPRRGRGAAAEVERLRAALEAERMHARELMQLVPDAYLLTDPAGIIREGNYAAAALLATAAHALPGRAMADFVLRPAAPAFRAELQRASALRRRDEWEMCVGPPGAPSGTDVVATVAAVRGAEDDGALRWILRDVTEQRRMAQISAAHTAAERQRAFLEEVVRQMPGGVLIAEPPDGAVVLHNAEAERILREPLSRETRIGAYGRARLLRDDGSEAARDEYPLVRALTLGERSTDRELVFRLGDGSRVVLSASAAPVVDAQGRIVAAVSVCADVTRARRAEARERFLARVGQVLSSTLEYREVMQQVARLCIGALADYCLVHVEEGDGVRAYGVAHVDPRREEEMREFMRRYPLPPTSPHPVLRALRTGRAERVPRVKDGMLRRIATGPEHLEAMRGMGITSVMVVPLRARGRTLGAISLWRTGGDGYSEAELAGAEELARRAALAVSNARLYEETRRAVRARDELVAVVSHDLRNPLNAVLIASTILSEMGEAGALDAETQRRQLDVIRRSAEQMTSLANDLVEVASLESGAVTMHPRPTAPAVLLRAAMAMFQGIAEARRIALEAEEADALPEVTADYGRVLQVLGNLVGNAFKFCPAGGRVRLWAYRDGGTVCFCVEDTGPGIDPEHLPHLFDRFWQARRGAGAGAGLGLAIARSLVEAHGGRIWAESPPEGGSTFHFTLPVVEDGGDGEDGTNG